MSNFLKPLAERLDMLAKDGLSMIALIERGDKAKRENIANRAQVTPVSKERNRERLSEREFVRGFGDKVKKVRYSGRADYIGLTVLGKFQGFIITSGKPGDRKVRLIDIDEAGHAHVTKRFLQVKDHESISNLQRGLLKWVR